MAVEPYRLKLKKVSRAKLRLLDAIYSYLPATGLRDQFLKALKESVQLSLGEGFALRMETLEQESYASYLAKLPKHPMLAVIGLGLHSRKMIIEIDSTLAMMAVERMLGGHVESMPEPRPLTETEQGVLQYLLLTLLLQVHRACGTDARVHFRFEKFAFSPGDVARLADEDSTVAVVAYRAVLGRHAGFVRLAFTEPFVEEAMLSAISPGERRPLELMNDMDAMGRLGYVRVPIWAEAGRSTINAGDINQLEEGDVVLLENGDIRLAEGVEGRALLRIGEGMHGGIDVTTTLSPKRATCRVRSIHKGA